MLIIGSILYSMSLGSPFEVPSTVVLVLHSEGGKTMISTLGINTNEKERLIFIYFKVTSLH